MWASTSVNTPLPPSPSTMKIAAILLFAAVAVAQRCDLGYKVYLSNGQQLSDEQVAKLGAQGVKMGDPLPQAAAACGCPTVEAPRHHPTIVAVPHVATATATATAVETAHPTGAAVVVAEDDQVDEVEEIDEEEIISTTSTTKTSSASAGVASASFGAAAAALALSFFML